VHMAGQAAWLSCAGLMYITCKPHVVFEQRTGNSYSYRLYIGSTAIGVQVQVYSATTMRGCPNVSVDSPCS
jgi:hypothetical protein